MGLSHYEKAIGDLTSAMLTLTALAMLIVGIWLLTRNWKQTPGKAQPDPVLCRWGNDGGVAFMESI